MKFELQFRWTSDDNKVYFSWRPIGLYVLHAEVTGWGFSGHLCLLPWLQDKSQILENAPQYLPYAYFP